MRIQLVTGFWSVEITGGLDGGFLWCDRVNILIEMGIRENKRIQNKVTSVNNAF